MSKKSEQNPTATAREKTTKLQIRIDDCDNLIDLLIDDAQEPTIYTSSQLRSEALDMLRNLRNRIEETILEGSN